MPLTLAQMHALFNDNTAGDISAQDGRDVLQALWRRIYGVETNPGADDVYWDGDDNSSMTEVTVTGTHTIVENGGYLSVLFDDQDAGDINCLLKAVTISNGDTWQTDIRQLANSAHNFAGVVMTDGTTSAANVVMVGRYVPANILFAYHGTLTTLTTVGFELDTVDNFFGPQLWVGVELDASNSYKAWFSSDGIQRTQLAQAAVSKTMTPTHVGVAWSSYSGTADNRQATFGPLRKVT